MTDASHRRYGLWINGLELFPKPQAIDRRDRLVQTRELLTLLEFYLERAERYGVIAPEAAEEARFFLRTLEEDYRLAFTRSAIIFDFEKPGTEPPQIENGIEYHRIGIDLIRQLIEAAAPATASMGQLASAVEQVVPSRAAPKGLGFLQQLRERAPSVPTLDEAAFLGGNRERSVSWEQLQARRSLGTQYPEPRAEAEEWPEVAEEGLLKEEHDKASGAGESQTGDRADTPPQGACGTSGKEVEIPSPQVEAAEEAASSGAAGPEEPGPSYDVLLGVTGPSPQYGLLGEFSGRKVALDLNHTHTISLFGVQGGGKSYTLGAIAEMASLAIPQINRMEQPLATVIFHYSPTMDYRPEFTSMVAPNTEERECEALHSAYGAAPRALSDVALLVPSDKLEKRRGEYPGLEVCPLKFAASELQASHWRFLMGAVGNQATYIRQLNRVMKSLRNDLTLNNLRRGIDDSSLSDHLKDLARMRLDLAAEYIDDTVHISSLIRPGRLVIVDLREEFIEKDEALGLFVVLLQLFADAKDQGSSYNNLVVFDEAHKYIDSADLVAGLIEVVREMRHKGTSTMVASQDPPSVPVALIELSSQIILHKFNSPAWLKHIEKANAALGGLTAEKMAHLKPGEAYIWSSKATDDAFTTGAVKVKLRPRVTKHGGETKKAIPSS